MGDWILKEIDILKDRCEKDVFILGKIFFSHYFRKISSGFHKKVLDEAVRCLRLGIAAPRESAKSCLLGFLYPIYVILFKKKHFIIFLMNTEEKAKGALAGIKKEIKDNKLLAIFDVSIEKDTETDTVFKVGEHRVRVLCKGATQMGSIRGERFGAYRPDLVVVDDLEDDEMVRNPIRRRELQEVFDDAVEPAVDRDEGQIIFIGTVLHDDSLIRKITSKDFYPEYRKLFYQALKNGKSLWSAKWTVEDLKEIEKNNPEKFAKEYQNDPISGIRRTFERKDFRYWTINDGLAVLFGIEGNVMAKYSLKDCRAGIGCDLAWEEKRQSDETVIMPGLLTPNDEILIDEYVNKKGMKPDELEEILFTMVEKYEKMTDSICKIGFEKAKHEKIMKWMLSKAQPKRRKYLVIEDIKWDSDKITRIITALQPRYVNHTVFHRQGMGDLEYQLMRVPDGSHDDLADAAHILSKILKFPKKIKNEPEKDDMFEWLRNRHIAKTKRKEFLFGNKDRNKDCFPFPTQVSYL